MESGNILSVNVPNLITITLMAIVGMFLLGLAQKGVQMLAQRNGG